MGRLRTFLIWQVMGFLLTFSSTDFMAKYGTFILMLQAGSWLYATLSHLTSHISHLKSDLSYLTSHPSPLTSDLSNLTSYAHIWPLTSYRYATFCLLPILTLIGPTGMRGDLLACVPCVPGLSKLSYAMGSKAGAPAEVEQPQASSSASEA